MRTYSNLSGKKIVVKLMVLASMSCAVLAFSSYASHAAGLQPLQIDPVTGDVTNLDVNNGTLDTINHMIDNDMQRLGNEARQPNAAAQRNRNRGRALRNFNYMAPEQILAYNNNADYLNNINQAEIRAREERRILRNLNYMAPEQVPPLLNNNAAQ